MEKPNQVFIDQLEQIKNTTKVVTSYQNNKPINKEFVLLLAIVVFIAGSIGAWLVSQWLLLFASWCISGVLVGLLIFNKNDSQSYNNIVTYSSNNNEPFKRLIVRDLTTFHYPQIEYLPNTARKKYPALPPNIEDIFRKDTKEEVSYVAAQLLSNHAIYYRFELPFRSHNSILLLRKDPSLFKKDGYTIRNPIALPIDYQSKTYVFHVQNREYATYLINQEFMDLMLNLAHRFSEEADFELFLKDNHLHISIHNEQDLFELNYKLSSETQIAQTTKQLHQLIEPLDEFGTKLSELMLIYKEKLPTEEVLDDLPANDDDIYDHLIDF